MVLNTISLDMKVDALKLKQKSTVGVSSGILQNFRTATFKNILQSCFLKNRGGEGHTVTSWFQVFTFSRVVTY